MCLQNHRAVTMAPAFQWGSYCPHVMEENQCVEAGLGWGVNFTCIETEAHCSDIHIRVYKHAFREKRGGNSYLGFLRKPKVRYFSQVRIRSNDFKLHDMHHKNLGLNPAVS